MPLSNRRLTALWLVVFLLNPVAPGQVTCDEFSLIATPQQRGQALSLRISSDLPDDTTLFLTASRSYTKAGDAETYSESYIASRFLLGDLRQDNLFNTSDILWERAIRHRQSLLSMIESPFQVARISEEVRIRAFIIGDQTDPRFGDQNEHLTGGAVVRSSAGYNTAQQEVLLQMPLKNSTPNELPSMQVHSFQLEKDRKYRLQNRCEFPASRADTTRNHGIRYLESSDIVHILKIDETGPSPWYLVDAFSAHSEELGTGWLSARSLIEHGAAEYHEPRPSPKASNYELVGPTRDVSFGNTRRYTTRIVVPLHLSRDEIETILREVTMDLYKKKARPKAISVFAYMPGDNTEWTYTVAMSEYAPNGVWADARKPDPMAFSFKFGTSYFDICALSIRLVTGETVRLIPTVGHPVLIAESFDDWSDAGLIAALPDEAEAEIVDVRFRAIGANTYSMWARVKTNTSNGLIEGWVRHKDIAFVP